MHTRHTGRITGLCAAGLSTFSAYAAEGQDLDPTKPVSKIVGCVGWLSDPAPRFGEYNGINDSGVYPLIDLSIVNGDDRTGSWFRLVGRNLGIDKRCTLLGLEHQGQWGVTLD